MSSRTFLPAIAGALGFLLLAVATLAPGGSPSALALTNCDTQTAANDASEQQMLVLINDARAQQGAIALKFSPNLNRAAAWKSADSSASGQGFSHTDSLKRDAGTRIQQCGYAGSGWGENILWGTTDPQTAFDMWMSSTGHRDNILRTTYRVIGIGRVGSNWTTDFGTTDDSGVPPTASPTVAATVTPAPTAAPTAVPSQETFLNAGLNLITYDGPPQPPGQAFASLGGSLIAMYAWDPARGWQRYLPGLPEYVTNIALLRPGTVLFLELSSPAVWRR